MRIFWISFRTGPKLFKAVIFILNNVIIENGLVELAVHFGILMPCKHFNIYSYVDSVTLTRDFLSWFIFVTKRKQNLMTTWKTRHGTDQWKIITAQLTIHHSSKTCQKHVLLDLLQINKRSLQFNMPKNPQVDLVPISGYSWQLNIPIK